MKELLQWDIYEVTTANTSINGVMLRGRIRKLGLERRQNILTENTQDIDASVRFAVLHGDGATEVISYLESILPDGTIKLILESVSNPVLSKLKVNKQERYTL